MKNLQRPLFGPFQTRQAEEEVFRVQVTESARLVDLTAIGWRAVNV